MSKSVIILALCATVHLTAQIPFNLPSRLVRTPGTPSQTLYAVANGLFRSTDGGVNWTALHITQPGRPQPTISSMIIDSRN